MDALLANPGLQKVQLARGYGGHLALARQNRKLLREFVRGRGLCMAISADDTPQRELPITNENGGAACVA